MKYENNYLLKIKSFFDSCKSKSVPTSLSMTS